MFLDSGIHEKNPVIEGTDRTIIGPLTGDGSNAGTGIEDISIAVRDLFITAMTEQGREDSAVLDRALSGADSFSLSDRADLARGFGGDDTLRGRGGDDRLFGDAGADRLEAGSGRGVLVGGAGRDTLVGGTDCTGDVFVLTARQDSGTGAAADAIANFTSEADDIILREIDARPSTGTNESFLWGGQMAARFSVWWEASGKDVVLHADLTGDARRDFDLVIGGTTRLS